MGKPTIIDLAKHLGISKTTVADALKGSGRVADETRAKVAAAAKEIGYVSNRAARQLRESSTGAIALYVPQRVRNMSFYMPFALGVADEAAKHGYDLTLVSDRAADRSGWTHVDGAILVDAMMDDPVVQSLLPASVPIVTAGRVAGLPEDRIAGIIEIEHAKMCGEVLDAMAMRGARHPALICPEPGDEYSWARQIVAGYKQWCSGRNLRPVIEIVSSFPTNAELEASLTNALSSGSIDSLLFGWQDVAQRAEAALIRIGHNPGQVKLASLLSSQDSLNDSYVAGLNLQPYEFGLQTAAVLCASISTPQLNPTHQVHEALVVLPI
ncbi:UNVERIFIED_CONTAM: DNA-binding LacI/PurR family transcriptional regulator [Jeotgalibacillus campisalis]